MPTAAKLAAAILFFIVGWIAANVHVPALGEGENVGFFRELVGLIGVVCGWKVMGPSVGRGYREAIGSGLKTVIVLTFFALLLFSIYVMIGLSMRRIYDGPVDAVLAVFSLMLEEAQKMLTPWVLGTLIIGGSLAGLITERISRRWP